jgi:Zn-dependent metalloprotease/subtilisin-like proprotein convertase family protein
MIDEAKSPRKALGQCELCTLTVGMGQSTAGSNRDKRVARPCMNVLLAGLLAFCIVAVASLPTRASIDQSIESMLRSARARRPGIEEDKLQVRRFRLAKTREGFVHTLGAPAKQHFPVLSVPSGGVEAAARRFLSQNKTAFGMTRPGFRLISRETSRRNRKRHVRFRQAYAGIPVFAAETIVQVNEEGGVEYVTNDVVTGSEALGIEAVSLQPTFGRVAAEQIAVSVLTQLNPGWTFQTEAGTLTLYQPSVVGNVGQTHLVWQTKVTSTPEPWLSELVLVDAHDGDVVLHYSLVKNDLYREVYDAGNWIEREASQVARMEGNPPFESLPDVDLAYIYLEDAYQFYAEHHGRDGIDDAGMTLQAYLRFCLPGRKCPWPNAGWVGQGYNCMVFGQGYITDDVVGHEFTHGVTDHASGLVYLNESGAIDESFADIWGEFIDLTNGRGDDLEEERWLHGEDLKKRGFLAEGQSATRNMKNPSEAPYFQPDHVGSKYWDWDPLQEDNGGVHTNCGVNNKLCYLLTDGDTFRGFTIVGMGIARIAELYYEVQTRLLPKAANYRDLYFALIQAAVNLDWTEGELLNLEQACQAVAIAYDGLAYTSEDVPKEIRSQETTYSTLTIEEAGMIADLNVSLDIEHTWVEDLEAVLVSPAGIAVKLFAHVGRYGGRPSSGKDFHGTVFDDEAPVAIRYGLAPFNGSYRPEGILHDFVGQNITGTWTLQVTDSYEEDEGELRSWTLFAELLPDAEGQTQNE